MICSGAYDGRNYCVDLSNIRKIELKDIKNECVIYGISGNYDGGNLYIGSTNNHERRFFKEHLDELKNNEHVNKHLQNSYNKHGFNNFNYFILDKCIEEQLLSREQNWLDYYNSTNPSILFNISKLADRPCYPKEYLVTYPDGRKELIFNLTKFCEKYKIYQANMLKVANGILSNTHGYKCRYPEDKEQKYVKSSNNGGKVTAIQRAKDYIITFPDGHEEIIHNLRDFALKNNLDDAALRHVCSGKISHTKNYKCRYINEDVHKFVSKSRNRKWKLNSLYREYLIIFPNGDEIQINNLQKFCKENRLNRISFLEILKGNKTSYKGHLIKKVNPKDYIYV